jgi:Fe(3+) dicitrate transport protein
MKLFYFLFFISYFFAISTSEAQHKVSGKVIAAQANKPLVNVGIFDVVKGELTRTNEDGYYEFSSEKESITIAFYTYEFKIVKRKIILTQDTVINIALALPSTELSEVLVLAEKEELFNLKRLSDVEGTSVYAGKKTEVVLVEHSMANLASNNARQIYSQVAGLNIYQNDDAGLQLNIGGRGLDPNRTANFSTKQNGYDISADVLGYPESYYTPAAEALKEVQIIRGAASLQYGTQFGGLVNFIMKEPNPHKPIELVARNTLGNNGLYTNFTSISGTHKKFSYYTFANYKKGNGFRPNSEFESVNLFTHLGYQVNAKIKLTAELTSLKYIAQQAGGLTDQMFEEDPLQSNRSRNWFQVKWLLYNTKLAYKISDKTNFSFSFFGLNASRDALGFRTNRVSQVDLGTRRDLIKGDFNNFGFEARLLSKYKLLGKNATFLIGGKYYNASNTSQQGAGSDGSDANFEFIDFPNYANQSNYTFPNLNTAIFGENIIYLNEKVSITPGFRLEYINTKSDGFYKKINLDAAGNVILNQTIEDKQVRERSFLLLGLGLSYKPNDALEIYGNVSQNYRSVTFSDISIVNPAYVINPTIDDEKGYTMDLGLRGNLNNIISFDVGLFSLFYQNRIGFKQKALPDGSVKTERGNVGDAVMYGMESLLDFNLRKLFSDEFDYSFNYFINISTIDSKYTKSLENGVEGNKVEFIPNFNFKTGIKFGYKNLLSNIQFTYLSEQFTDASNASESNLSGVIGTIPAYDVLDFSMSYTYKKAKLELGVNNLLDKSYFTRRATGYPGPGIIPSANRNFYLTFQLKI